MECFEGAHPEARRAEGSLKNTRNTMGNQRGYFYILTNKGKKVLYVGSTKDLLTRINEHKRGYQKGFTYRYNINHLIYYEIYEHIENAKDRERKIKGWTRKRKIQLIETKNKEWKDLNDDIVRDPSLRSG